jgi:hypothetical protein
MTAEEKLAAIKLHVEKAMAASKEMISEYEDEDGDITTTDAAILEDIDVNKGIIWLGENIMKIVNE